MSRRSRLSLAWGISGAVFGIVIGAATCWSLDAPWLYWLGLCFVLALLCGAMGSFFGGRTIELLFDFLSYLIC